MSQLQALREVHTETAAFNELAPRINGLPLEPRCRVCRNDEVRQKVNDLLSGGASYAMILRTLEQDNAKLDQRDRVTIDSIRHHTKRHFPVQNVAKATYRRNPRAAGAGERRRLRQGRGHRDHPDGVLRDRDGQGL